MLRFSDDRFKEAHCLTIGVEYANKVVKVLDKEVKLQIWDTAGTESFKSITRGYYKSSIGAFLVYDVTSRSSFEHITTWLSELREHAGAHLSLCLVGNKCDLSEQRQVKTSEANEFAQNEGMQFIETSAKSGINVEKCFMELATEVLNRTLKGEFADKGDDVGVRVLVKNKDGNEQYEEENGLRRLCPNC